MAEETYDGHPEMNGLLSPRLTGEHPEFSTAGLLECVVVDRRFVDEPGNRLRTSVEYDVRDLNTGEVLPSCRVAARMFGFEDGEEQVLRPASKSFKPGQRFNKSTRANDTDGDIVVVGCISGSRERGVILGVLAHSKASYGTKLLDGERRFIVHKGSTLLVDKAGNLDITHKSGAFARIADDGTITLVPADGKTIELGGADLGLLDGLVHGSGKDPYTGQTYTALQNASAVVKGKK
jgi:hypothetical protein